MESAFGVEHGEVSKRKRDTGRGASKGAAYGALTGATLGGVGSTIKARRLIGKGPKSGLITAGIGAAGATQGTAIGALAGLPVGAAIGAKKEHR